MIVHHKPKLSASAERKVDLLVRNKLGSINAEAYNELELLEHQHHCLRSDKFTLPCTDRLPWSKIDTFKLELSLQPTTWTKVKLFWKVLVIWDKDQLVHNDQRYIWRRKGEAPKNKVPTVIRGSGSQIIWSCSAGTGTVDGIMKKED